MNVVQLRHEGGADARLAEAVGRFVAQAGVLQLLELRSVPSRALRLFAEAERARLYGGLRAQEELVLANLEVISGPERGATFTLGMIVADAEVRRVFDPVPLKQAIERAFGVTP